MGGGKWEHERNAKRNTAAEKKNGARGGDLLRAAFSWTPECHQERMGRVASFWTLETGSAEIISTLLLTDFLVVLGIWKLFLI